MTYDADGNTLSDGTNTYVWDARNRLASADGGGATFAYDAVGRRVSKTVQSVSTYYLYDGVNPVEELSVEQGGPPGPMANLLTGLGVDERFERTDSTGSYFYLTDALGSTVALTNSAGASVEQYSYGPYGMLSATGSNTNPYTYTGREEDGLGIYYYRARYYNPATGRFISEDPAGFAGSGTNLYAYTADNPLSFTDPMGTNTWQLGFSINISYNGWGFHGSVGIAVDTQGNVGGYTTGGLGSGKGVGWSGSGGVSAAYSDAPKISDLGGPFVNASGTFGDGVSGTGDMFFGQSPRWASNWLRSDSRTWCRRFRLVDYN